MKILLSAFACAPNSGSETGGGWQYALHLAKTHDVWVLTDSSRKAKIEGEGGTLPPRLRIHYFRPNWLRHVPLNSRTAHFTYQAWQFGAWRVAKELDREHDFDFCWHLTYGVFRQPSYMWKLGKPFVFGPVGGGESAPLRLWKSMPLRAKISEAARELVNRLCWFMPGLKATYKNAALVIARTEDTKRILPAFVRDDVVVQQEIGGYLTRTKVEDRKQNEGGLRIIFVGRLLALKGIHLAIVAFAKFLARGGIGEFTIVGEGPMDSHLRKLSVSLGVHHHIHFVGHLPQHDLFDAYSSFDVMLFPSLHDSGGNAVIEALSFGLPVICLDLGGPKSFVDDSCGLIVSTVNATEKTVIERLTAALIHLHGDSTAFQIMSRNALSKSEFLSWHNQADRLISTINEKLNSHAH